MDAHRQTRFETCSRSVGVGGGGIASLSLSHLHASGRAKKEIFGLVEWKIGKPAWIWGFTPLSRRVTDPDSLNLDPGIKLNQDPDPSSGFYNPKKVTIERNGNFYIENIVSGLFILTSFQFPKKPPALQREYLTFTNLKFHSFFYCLDPDPIPKSQKQRFNVHNADSLKSF